MAVYKPSNCIPFMDALNLMSPQDISCELNTSNVNITGYKIKVLDNQNNVVFEGSKFTPLNDKTLRNYNNSGENGSVLTLPMIVTDPDLMNENTILFDNNSEIYSKYEDSDYQNIGKLLASNKSLYYKWYTRVTYEDVSDTIYKEAVNKKQVAILRDISYSKDEEFTTNETYENAVWNEYYYSEYFEEFEYKPEYEVAVEKEYYYINQYGKPDKVANIDENGYANIKNVYEIRYNYESRSKTEGDTDGWNAATGANNAYYRINDSGDGYIKMTQEEYRDATIVYIPRYIFVGGIESSYFYEHVFTVYRREYEFVELSDLSDNSNYDLAIKSGNYYLAPGSGLYKLVTELPFGYHQMIKDDNNYFYIKSNGKGLFKKKDKTIIDNFYNGAPNQPYKWRISLAQGDYLSDVANLNSKWYDMTVTNGKVLGSTNERIQGLISNQIYKDYYIQLNTRFYTDSETNPDATFVGSRVRVSSYDYSFGYVYPTEGSYKDDVIAKGIDGRIPQYFSIYKWTNNPDDVSSSRKVSYTTTRSINVEKIGTHELKESFRLADNKVFFTQKYSGEVLASDIKMSLYNTNFTSVNDVTIDVGTTTLLIKDQTDSSTDNVGEIKGSAYNGVFQLSLIEYDAEEKVTTLRWQRAAIADTLADMIGQVYFVTNTNTNYENDLVAGTGVLNSTPITFKQEKPIEIYPTPDEQFENLYTSLPTDTDSKSWILKHFSPIFKTDKDYVYIRPFVGIADDMRFSYTKNNSTEYFEIEGPDDTIWRINNGNKDPDIKPGDDYAITSFFKIGDENPFYAYDEPTVDLIIENGTENFVSSGAEIINERKLIVNALYLQPQNISWKNYKWSLYNDTDGYTMSQTDAIYSGGFCHEFIGIENGSYYTVSLTIETETGDQLSVSKQVYALIDVKTNVNFNAEFDCKLQAIKFQYVRDGKIIPTPMTSVGLTYGDGTAPDTSFLQIADEINERNYGVEYSKVLSFSIQEEELQTPDSNSITINSSHILDEYFEGEILNIIINISEENGSQTRQRITIDTGYDLKDDGGGFYVENPDRNKMKAYVIKEVYGRGVWNAKNIVSTYIGFYDEEGRQYISEDLYAWRKKQPVLFEYIADGSVPREDCDYLRISGPDVNNQNLRYLLPPYAYNVFSTDYLKESMENGEKQIVDVLGVKSKETTDNTVWCDYQLTPTMQINGDNTTVTGVLDLTKPTYWYDTATSSREDGATSVQSEMYWRDSKQYAYKKQVSANAMHNHSGRQDFAKLKFTFNIVVENLDQTITQSNTIISARCFVSEVSNLVDASDATVTAADVMLGKTVYGASGKITGTIKTYDGEYQANGPETWVLNTSISKGQLGNKTFATTFQSNGTIFNSIVPSALEETLSYDSTHVFTCPNVWPDEAYRTITFSTAPTGDLLTWLQANGTKQGGVTSGYTVTIQFDYGPYSPLADLSGQAFYSLDNGTTWIDCIGNSRPEQIVLENVTQIKFKGVSTGVYDEYFDLYNGTGDLSAILKYSTSDFTTNNVEITQTSTIKMYFHG